MNYMPSGLSLSGARKERPVATETGIVMSNRFCWSNIGDVRGMANVVLTSTCTLSVAVRAIGAPLPPFALPGPVQEGGPDVELAILHEDAWPWEPGTALGPVHGCDPRYRFVIHDHALATQVRTDGLSARSNMRVGARAGSLDVVAEALAALVNGALVICVDVYDLRYATGMCRPGGGDGSAVVAEGLVDADRAVSLRDALSPLRKDGFDGGFVLMQLVARDDEEAFTLFDLDAATSLVMKGWESSDLVLSACFGATRSAMVAIAFTASRRGAGAAPDDRRASRSE